MTGKATSEGGYGVTEVTGIPYISMGYYYIHVTMYIVQLHILSIYVCNLCNLSVIVSGNNGLPSYRLRRRQGTDTDFWGKSGQKAGSQPVLALAPPRGASQSATEALIPL